MIVDDVYLKLGVMRVREQGSAGGHNGLKSVEEHLHSHAYSRLRMGVGGEEFRSDALEAYVLGNFNSEEQKRLPQVTRSGAAVARSFVTQGIEPARQLAGELKDTV